MANYKFIPLSGLDEFNTNPPKNVFGIYTAANSEPHALPPVIEVWNRIDKEELYTTEEYNYYFKKIDRAKYTGVHVNIGEIIIALPNSVNIISVLLPSSNGWKVAGYTRYSDSGWSPLEDNQPYTKCRWSSSSIPHYDDRSDLDGSVINTYKMWLLGIKIGTGGVFSSYIVGGDGMLHSWDGLPGSLSSNYTDIENELGYQPLGLIDSSGNLPTDWPTIVEKYSRRETAGSPR